MSIFNKIPSKIQALIIISYIMPLLFNEYFFQGDIFELRWFFLLIPVSFFAYYFGLKGGIISSILSDLFFLLWETFEMINGEYTPTWEIDLDIFISLTCFFLAISIGLLANKLHHLTFKDPLTDLFNRRYINNYQLPQKRLTILFIDLDRFKLINDSLGHHIGDLILKAVSDRLKGIAGEHDIIARLGGDEFVLLMEEVQIANVKKKAKEVLQYLSIPYYIENNELYLTASIGITQSPDYGQEIDTLITKADIAMYQAKQDGKNQYQFYIEEMNEKALEYTELENKLHKAIKQKEFILYYQPKVHLKTNKLVGMEALIRWQHPQHGIISPCRFIPIAEETGLIVPLGAWVMYHACKQNKKWQEKGFPPVRVSVNISVRQFQHHLVSTVEKILNQTGLEPQWLELEITESMLMKNVKESVQTLHQLKSLGVHLSIDDFGTGYSSLNYIKRFPIDCLKIDKSFVNDIQSDASIANAIITLAHNLKMKVIAEGIEDKTQAQTLQGQNCDFGQGYLYSPPVPKQQFEINFLHSKYVS